MKFVTFLAFFSFKDLFNHTQLVFIDFLVLKDHIHKANLVDFEGKLVSFTQLKNRACVGFIKFLKAREEIFLQGA